MLEGIRDREKDTSGAMQPGATNLTIVSTVVAALAAAATAFTDVFQDIFPDATGARADWIKLALLVAIIFAAAAVVVADLTARSRVAAAAARSAHLFAAPEGLRAKMAGRNGTFPVKQLKVLGDADGTTEIEVKLDGKDTWQVLDDRTWSLTR